MPRLFRLLIVLAAALSSMFSYKFGYAQTAQTTSGPAPVKPPMEWPTEFQGPWYLGSTCDAVGAYLNTQDSYSIALFPAVVNGKKIISAAVASSNIIQKIEGNTVTIAGRTFNASTKQWELVPLKHTMLGDRRTNEVGMPLGKTLALVRCANPKFVDTAGSTYEGFVRDLASLIDTSNMVRDKCGGPKLNEKLCASAIVDALDVNRDGKISPAEIAYWIRRWAKLSLLANVQPLQSDANIQSTQIDDDSITTAAAGGVLVGPLVTHFVMGNLDYDGNGFITADEIALTIGGGTSVAVSKEDATQLFGKVSKSVLDMGPALNTLGALLGVGTRH